MNDHDEQGHDRPGEGEWCRTPHDGMPSAPCDDSRHEHTHRAFDSSTALLVAAMPEEFDPLKARLDAVQSITLPGIHDAVLGRYDHAPILLILSGIGLVNAAHAATVGMCLGPSVAVDAGIGIEESAGNSDGGTIGCVMSVGTAGVAPGYASIGDVVVSSTVIPGDFDLTAFGYDRGQVPGLTAPYPGDPDLVAAADAIGITALDFVSVDRFIGVPEAAALRDSFPTAAVVDMESSALAQTAVLHRTPFTSVRSITDVIGESETSVHLDEVHHSSQQAAEAALTILTQGRSRLGAR